MKEATKTYLTEEGLAKLQADLDELKNVRRPEIIQALKDARALGDLSENAEYDAARSAQAECESKITELETYSIVGSKEVDLFNNKISNESPIAQAIMGAKVGDVKTVNSPSGSYDVK